MFCHNCGTRIMPTNATFCSSCGGKLALDNQSTGSAVKQGNATSADSFYGPSGVAGWLRVLVGVLMIVVPLFGVASLLSHLAILKYLYPSLLGTPGWNEYQFWMWLAVTASSLLSIYGSLRLLKGRSTKDLDAVSTIIWVVGPISALVVHGAIPYWLHSSEKLMYDYIGPTGTPLVGAILGGTLFSLAWISYLNRSTRVRNTYHKPDTERQSTDH